MALAVSTVAEYRQDPKFMQELEMRTREELVGANVYNTMFDPALEKGRQITVNREAFFDSTSTDAVSSITYQSINSDGDQTFTIDDAVELPVRVFDVDKIQSVQDLHNLVMDSGMFSIKKYLDEKAFSKLQANGALSTSLVDLTAISGSAAKGNALYDRIMEANQSFDSIGLPQTGRQIIQSPQFFRYIKDADKLTSAVDPAYLNTVVNGRTPYAIDGVLNLAQSINLKKDTTNYNVSAKGNIVVGSIGYSTVIVDNNGSGTIIPPQAGDTFTNNSKTFTIRGVKEITANVEYQLYLNRPIETQINDNATITITGNHTVYVPVMHGKAGTAVIQSRPDFEAMRDPDYHATLLRTLVVFDYFLTRESTTKVVHVPVKYRTI